MMTRLGAQGSFVKKVAEYPKREDGHSQSVAGIARISTGKLGQDFVMVLWDVALGLVPVVDI